MRPVCLSRACSAATLSRALLVTYCTNLKCPASRALAARLTALGYTHVLEYPEGIEGWVSQKSGCTLSEAGVFPHVLHISETAPLPLLNQLFEICNVPVKARSLRADA